MAGDAVRMRVVINFDAEPDPRWFLLRGPHRLVIDLPKTKFAIDPKELKARGLVRNVRYGHINDKHLAPDPGGEGPVRRRQARHPAERGARPATAWWRISRRRSQSAFDDALARAGADDRLHAGDAEERAPGPADRPRRPALHHRHRSRPWRYRRRRGGSERHGGEGHHADLRRGIARQAARRRPLQRLHDAREGRVPAPRRPREDRQGATRPTSSSRSTPTRSG